MTTLSNALNQVCTSNMRPVTIIFNETAREVPYDLVKGRKISAVVSDNARYLGVDTSRVANYVVNGEMQSGDTTVRAGDYVRVAVNSESKGM